MPTYDVVGVIEAYPGFVDIGDAPSSSVPVWIRIQRRWGLFLSGGRGHGNPSYPSGTVLINVVPPMAYVGMLALRVGTVKVIDPDSKVESASKQESQVWTQTGGIMRGRPAQWWVSYMPSHIVDYGFSSASSKTRMGDLSGTTSAEIAPHGTANVRTKGGI